MAKVRVKPFCPNCGEMVICFPVKRTEGMYRGTCETEDCKARIAVGDYGEGEKGMHIMVVYTGGKEVK